MTLALQASFDDLSVPLYDVLFCVLDLETTGGSPKDCEITEIGAVKYRRGELVGTFQTLVDPGAPIPPAITVLTGITQAMVFDAPSIETALPSFLEFIGDAVIVGHNVRFDLSFLNAAAERLGYGRLAQQRVDTAALARRLVRQEVRSLRLQSLATHFRSPVTPNHRALEDARATAHVLHALLERAGSLGVTNLEDLLQLPKAKGAPFYSKIALTAHLPREPGVYIFKDRQGTPIYVGKASNLRARVRQYFYGDPRRAIGNLMRELHSVDHVTCATLLEAEVTEVRLIHAHRPRHNRRSRPPKTSHFLKLTKEDFPRLSVVRTVRDDSLLYLGPFRTKRAAELVMMAIWDSLPLRRCRTKAGSRKGKCAPSQLGVALCPCDGSLGRTDYAAVVERMIHAADLAPDLLLEPIREKMVALSLDRRYEEAAWLRDRHEALARALEHRRAWRSLQGLGLCELETGGGVRALIDRGRLVVTWKPGSPAPLRPTDAGKLDSEEVPPSVEVAEEAGIIWNWMDREVTRIVAATGTWSVPSTRITRLKQH